MRQSRSHEKHMETPYQTTPSPNPAMAILSRSEKTDGRGKKVYKQVWRQIWRLFLNLLCLNLENCIKTGKSVAPPFNPYQGFFPSVSGLCWRNSVPGHP